MNYVYSLFCALGLFLISGTPPEARDTTPRILVMGDSLMAAHRISGRAISDSIAKSLGEPVADRSVSGARLIYKLPLSGALGMNIAKQFRPGKWDWIIVNGGGNDLWLGCGCNKCDAKMNKMISKDGRSGVLPGLLSRLRGTGAQVIYVGYLRSPGVGSPIEHCHDDGNELEHRVSALSKIDKGLHFVSLADLVPNGDRSFHAMDMIHPSLKASAMIGERLAKLMQK